MCKAKKGEGAMNHAEQEWKERAGTGSGKEMIDI